MKLSKLTVLFLTLISMCGCVSAAEPTASSERNDDMYGYKGELAQNQATGGVDPWVIGQPATIVNLVSGNDSLPNPVQCQFRDPGTYTASFSFVPFDDVTGATTAPVRCEATIKWMIGSVATTRRISVVDGTSIQGVAEAVNIQVVDTTVILGMGIDLGKKYQVLVSITKGARGSYQTPPILFQRTTAFTILANSSISVPVPQGVGVKAIMTTIAEAAGGAAIPDQGLIISQQNAQATVLASYDARIFPWIPLLPSVTQLRIRNTTGNDIVVTPIFAIDG